MEKSVIIIAVIATLVLCACSRKTRNDVKQFVFEEEEFEYDSNGNKSTLDKKDVTVYIGRAQARKESVNRDRGQSFHETKIVGLSGNNNVCAMHIRDYNALNYKYCVKQYHDKNSTGILKAYRSINRVEGSFTINGYPCQKLAVSYYGENGLAQQFHIYMTDKIRVKDRSNSKFLYPGFFEQYWKNDKGLESAIDDFIVRVDYFQSPGRIAKRFQFKSLNQSVKDNGFFSVPQDCPVYANEKVPQKILLEKTEECGDSVLAKL
ncbi:MAG TPA: hypothetical protein VK177_15720 [Flavobacteriales bacterium]|nr:hypothetical protein [Flavobacteriales bacterium]